MTINDHPVLPLFHDENCATLETSHVMFSLLGTLPPEFLRAICICSFRAHSKGHLLDCELHRIDLQPLAQGQAPRRHPVNIC